MDLGPVLRAHSYLRVERPPELWPAAVDDVALIRLLGETIVAALGRGAALGDVLLQANNVTIEHDAPIAAGDHVTLTIGGVGDWSPPISWLPDDPEAPTLVNDDVPRRHAPRACDGPTPGRSATTARSRCSSRAQPSEPVRTSRLTLTSRQGVQLRSPC